MSDVSLHTKIYVIAFINIFFTGKQTFMLLILIEEGEYRDNVSASSAKHLAILLQQPFSLQFHVHTLDRVLSFLHSLYNTPLLYTLTPLLTCNKTWQSIMGHQYWRVSGHFSHCYRKTNTILMEFKANPIATAKNVIVFL